MEKNNINNETPADRLNIVSLKYFKMHKDIADLLGITSGTLGGYLSGRHPITNKFTMRLETSAGISANYILNGIMPMMIDKNRMPIHKGKVPLTSNTEVKTQHGIIKQFILEYDGNKKVFRDNGEGSVVSLVIGDLEEKNTPFMAFNVLDDFEDDYDIAMNSTIILKKNYSEGDVVLYTYDDECKIGIYKDNNVTELKTKIVKPVQEIEIKGRVVGKYEKCRYKTKTGRIF